MINKLKPIFVAILCCSICLMTSCRHRGYAESSNVNALIRELDKRFNAIKYAQYTCVVTQPTEYPKGYMDNYGYIMMRKNGKVILFYYYTSTPSPWKGVRMEQFFTPRYGLLMDRFGRNISGGIYIFLADEPDYKARYEFETIPTKILTYCLEKGCKVSLLEDKKVMGFHSCGVKIIVNDCVNLGNKGLLQTVIMRFDKNTGILITDERYDKAGKLLYSRKVETLSLTKSILLASANLSTLEETKMFFMDNYLKIDINQATK